jgi:NAD(P)-dependent dehydrogenase (short-subunit alcohol dehydrogenase family)
MISTMQANGQRRTSKFDLTDRVAIVTGSSRGIGKTIALTFAEAGSHVVVAARTVDELEATAADIRALGRRALVVPTDVENYGQVLNMVGRAVAEFGRIDILVNNAGFGKEAPILETDEVLWDEMINRHLKSRFFCCKAVGKIMVQQKKGSIINYAIGRYSPTEQMLRLGAWDAAQGGVLSLTQALAREWAVYNVRVNAIQLGLIATPRVTKQFLEGNPEYSKEMLSRIPLGRFGTPEDVAAVVQFLASDASDYITGEMIRVDGGAGP